MNVDGTDVERVGGTTTLPALHGCLSLGAVRCGAVLGAGAGMAATAAGVPVHWHLAAVDRAARRVTDADVPATADDAGSA